MLVNYTVFCSFYGEPSFNEIKGYIMHILYKSV